MEKNNLDSNNSTGFDKDTNKDSLGFTRQYYSKSTKIGVIADIQYADVENETNVWSGETRRFRESLKCAQRAGKHFQNVGVDLVLQMGDILDGKSGKNYKKYLLEWIFPALKCTTTKRDSEEEIEVPRIDIMGNHELYLAKRNEWKNLSNFFDVSSNELRSYREICNDKWRLIFLDTYAVNVVEFTPDEIQGALEYPFKHRDQWPEKYRVGHEFLEENNLQALKGYSGEQKIDWFKGVPNEKKKFVPFNGGLGEKQLKWLKNQLSEAYQKKQLVCLFGHIPITKNNWSSKCILWDSEDLGKLLKESGQHTAAYFAGHTHQNYEINHDDLGNEIFCLQLASPLLAQPDEDCFGVLEFDATEEIIGDKTVVKGSITLHGSGAMMSTKIQKEFAFQNI